MFEALDEPEARVKYGSLKLLRLISETQPGLLYPEIDRIIRLLDSDQTIIRWGAILIIGNLASVDREKKIDRILERYLEPVAGPVMITAANTIAGAAQIARAKPYLAGRIAGAVVQAEAARYATLECRNVAIGHTIKALDAFFEHLPNPRRAIDFVRRQRDNPRPATRNKAATFLRKHDAL